jgi:hypothetical protein
MAETSPPPAGEAPPVPIPRDPPLPPGYVDPVHESEVLAGSVAPEPRAEPEPRAVPEPAADSSEQRGTRTE